MRHGCCRTPGGFLSDRRASRVNARRRETRVKFELHLFHFVDLLYNKLYNKIHNKSTTSRKPYNKSATHPQQVDSLQQIHNTSRCCTTNRRLRQVCNKSNSCTTSPQHSAKPYRSLYNKSTTDPQLVERVYGVRRLTRDDAQRE